MAWPSHAKTVGVTAIDPLMRRPVPHTRRNADVTIVLVMGVSGCGKTTIAAGLAERMGWRLLEGDAFHPAANVEKMRAGTPLTDDDRWPWLRAIAAACDAMRAEGQSAVVACSALKRAYREVLRPDILVFPRGDKSLIAARMIARTDHFMPAKLLDSQFATLEEPGADEHPIVLDITDAPTRLIDVLSARLSAQLPPPAR